MLSIRRPRDQSLVIEITLILIGVALVSSSYHIDFIKYHFAFRGESLSVNGLLGNNFVLPYSPIIYIKNESLTALLLTSLGSKFIKKLEKT